jgi:hypothetical protein
MTADHAARLQPLVYCPCTWTPRADGYVITADPACPVHGTPLLPPSDRAGTHQVDPAGVTDGGSKIAECGCGKDWTSTGELRTHHRFGCSVDIPECTCPANGLSAYCRMHGLLDIAQDC